MNSPLVLSHAHPELRRRAKGERRWALPFLLLLAAGCSAARSPQLPASAVSAAELQQLLAARRESLQSLRSEATISISSPERSAKARQFLIAQRPDKLRVEIFSPFGSIFALTTAGGELAAYVREENRVYRGRATPENLSRWAGFDLEVVDVVDLLMGTAPEREVVAATVYPEAATGRLRLRNETETGAQIVLFAGEPLLPVEVQEEDGEGEVLWRARFAAYRDVTGAMVPAHIAIELPRTEQAVDISMNDTEVNPPLAASVFFLPVPPGSVEVAL